MQSCHCDLLCQCYIRLSANILQVVSDYCEALDTTVLMHTAANSPHRVRNSYNRTSSWTQVGDVYLWVVSRRVVRNVTKCSAGHQIQSSRYLRALYSIYPNPPLKIGPMDLVEIWALWYSVGVNESGTKALCGVGVNCCWYEMTPVIWLSSIYLFTSLWSDTFS